MMNDQEQRNLFRNGSWCMWLMCNFWTSKWGVTEKVILSLGWWDERIFKDAFRSHGLTLSSDWKIDLGMYYVINSGSTRKIRILMHFEKRQQVSFFLGFHRPHYFENKQATNLVELRHYFGTVDSARFSPFKILSNFLLVLRLVPSSNSN